MVSVYVVPKKDEQTFGRNKISTIFAGDNEIVKLYNSFVTVKKKNEITVKNVSIKTMTINGIDYISLTDIAKQKNFIDPNGVLANWMRICT